MSGGIPNVININVTESVPGIPEDKHEQPVCSRGRIRKARIALLRGQDAA